MQIMPNLLTANTEVCITSDLIQLTYSCGGPVELFHAAVATSRYFVGVGVGTHKVCEPKATTRSFDV